MKTAIKTCAAFLLWWLVAHLAYAVILLDWFPFTEWSKFERGFHLGVASYIALFTWLRVRLEE